MMADSLEYCFNHPGGYAAVYTEETVQKLDARRAGRPSFRFNVIQKGDPKNRVVVANITPAELLTYQAEAERQGNAIDVYYYPAGSSPENKAGEASILSLRMQSGLSQKEFGKFLYGIPFRSIQNWEGGQKTCPDYLVKLIEYKLKKENIIPNGLVTAQDEKDATQQEG